MPPDAQCARIRSAASARPAVSSAAKGSSSNQSPRPDISKRARPSRFFWPADTLVKQWPRADMEQLRDLVLRKHEPALALAPLAISPRQPLGVFVADGSAMFRDVKVKPLPKGE